MKKILILFVLALGFVNYANNKPVLEDSMIENTIVLKNNYELKTAILNNEVFLKQLVCTATVTYNGEVQATFSVPIVDPSFTAMACQLAGALACAYIQEHGGTCP